MSKLQNLKRFQIPGPRFQLSIKSCKINIPCPFNMDVLVRDEVFIYNSFTSNKDQKKDAGRGIKLLLMSFNLMNVCTAIAPIKCYCTYQN